MLALNTNTEVQVHVIQEPYRLQKLRLSHSSLQMSHLNHGLQLILPENLAELKVSLIIRLNLPSVLFPTLPFVQHVLRLQVLGLKTLILALNLTIRTKSPLLM